MLQCIYMHIFKKVKEDGFTYISTVLNNCINNCILIYKSLLYGSKIKA